MSSTLPSHFAGVLPYVKAWVDDDDDGPCIELSGTESFVFEPYIGKLFVSYVVDEGATLRLITVGECQALGVSTKMLRKTAMANLSRSVEERGVRLSRHSEIITLLFDGNFEATLLLHDELWPHLHERLGGELFAVAPARDVLAVSAPHGLNELREVIARVWPDGDHLLTRDVYRRVNETWTLHLAS
jgi:uncharacterized protein YtpQ (UPF0354 family)